MFGIIAYPKFGGEHFILGSQFKEFGDARQHAEGAVCLRCNRFEIIHVDDGSVWQDARTGFAKPDPSPRNPKV